MGDAAGRVSETKTVIATTVKVGQWEVQIGGEPAKILGIKRQGSKSWLRGHDGIRWRNAMTDVCGQKPELRSFAP